MTVTPTAVAPTAVGNGLTLPSTSVQQSYVVKRCFFPSHGRLTRRVNHRLETGEQFVGFIWSFWWGPFCAFLVYAQPTH